MKVRRTRCLVNLGASALVVGAAVLIGGTTRSHALPPVDTPVSTDKVVQYLRERFAIPDNVKVTAEPLHNSTFPGFEETTVTTDTGKEQKPQTVYVTKDGRYMAVGKLFALGADPKADVLKYVRETFKIPDTTTLTAGPFEKSKYLEFHQTKVATGDGKSQDFFVTRDDKVVVLGDVMPMDVNLRRKALDTFNLHNQPGVGPATAPVTIVEYADLECPTCARFHAFLESQLVPRYGDKVRIVFKEFPLPMHDWSRVAAIANECAYQIAPSSFFAYRSMIFAHQTGINVANVRDAMLQYGEEVGLDRLKLAACIDSQASQARVEDGKKEGTAVGVSSTPTSFINGRMVVGMPPPEQYFALVDEALAKH
ncbi:MAG: DsbA family protein [Terriglobia bacterium]